MHTKKAVTEQLFVDLDGLPPNGEGVEFLARHQCVSVGPDIGRRDFRPEPDGNTFSEVRPQVNRVAKGLLHGGHLQCEMPEGEGAYIHLKTLAVGELTFVRDRSDASIWTIPHIGAEVHVYEPWDASMFPESMTDTSGEERLSITGTIVDDNRLRESKKSD